MNDNATPTWPDDILYLPVEDSGKGPDVTELPGTWGYDGTGCTIHGDTYERRWGIVDVDRDGWRLLTVDLDVHKMDAERAKRVRDAIGAVPATRIHESQSGGLHVFFWIRDSDLTDRGKLPVRLADEIDDKLNGYVLSPHCAGYEILEDRQPATVDPADLPEAWTDGERQSPADAAGLDPGDARRDDVDDLSVYDVINPGSYPEGVRVAHPIHGSSTGTNFMVDPGADTWRCWRHDTTGNALHLLGMDAGILSCGEWPVGSETWSEIFEEAEERGLIEPSARPGDMDTETVADYAHTLDRRRSFETIEDIDLPQSHSYVLDKPPRAGGSYAVLQDFSYSDMPFMVLAPRHSILDYHVETVSELVDEDTSIVHLKGKARVCESGGGECELIPRDRDAYQDAMEEIRNIVHRGHVIRPSDAPPGICKHWFLSKAAEFADVILTVPQIARRVEVERENMKLFVDEEQTLDYFHPGSIELVSVGTVTETDGNTTVQLRGAPILSELDTLQEIVESIDADQRERARENPSGEYREQSFEGDIRAAVETVEDIADALGITAAKREVLSRGEDPTLSATVDELRERLAAVEFPDPDTDPDRLVEKISEYARPYFWSDEIDPGAALTAVLFEYDDHPFHWKQTGGEYTVRLIGDKRQVFHGDFFREFEQVAIIAGPGGERFIEKVRPDPVVVELESFPYADDFVVVPLGKRNSEGEMEPVDSQRRRVERTTKLLNAKPHPHIAVTGTKDRAEQLDTSLRKTTSNVVSEPEDPAMELYKMWTAAESAIIYENSIVSRGIDAPYFDVTTIVAPGFATPYWEARAAHYRGEEDGEDRYLEAVAVQQELKDRELTNAALRMSHTYDTADKLGTKFIITAYDDAERLKYVSDQVTPKMTYADQAADLVALLTAQGSLQAELESVSEALGGGHKDFTAVALDEEFSETQINRPDYAFDDVEGWVDTAYLNQEAVKTVQRAIQRADPPRTMNVIDRAAGLSNSRVKAILNILEKKGWAFSMKGKSTGGRPPTLWELSDSLL